MTPVSPTASERLAWIGSRSASVLRSGTERAGRAARALAEPRREPTPLAPPDRATIETFLAREARLLDERRWDDWLTLWALDGTYAVPTRRTVLPDGAPVGVEDELVPDGGTWWFDETRAILELRVLKLKTGKAWSEEPPSRTRRFVTNVEVAPGAGSDDGITVRSNLLIHRGRRDSDVEWFSCGRTDRVGTVEGHLRLLARRVVLDANVVPADNLVLFF